MNQTLMAYLKDHIISAYEAFDLAHQPSHVYSIIENSMEIAKDFDVDMDMVYVIACYHDIGMQYGRKDHHLTGGRFLYDDHELNLWFTEEQRTIMKEAIEDHRASSETPPRSIYGKIIAESDRDIEPMNIIERTVQFGFKHYPELSKNEHMNRAILHLEEKYGPNGYLKLWLKTKKNEAGLKEIHRMLEEPESLLKVIEAFYDDLKKNL